MNASDDALASRWSASDFDSAESDLLLTACGWLRDPSIKDDAALAAVIRALRLTRPQAVSGEGALVEQCDAAEADLEALCVQWERLAGLSSLPLALRARLCHLLWLVKKGRWGHEAVGSYLLLARVSTRHMHERAADLAYAWHIARSSNSTAVSLFSVYDAAVDLARRSGKDSESEPAAVKYTLWVISEYVQYTNDAAQSLMKGALQTARSPRVMEPIVEYVVPLVDQPSAAEKRRDVADAWLREAEAATNVHQREHCLRAAARYAEKHGLGDKRGEAVERLSRITGLLEGAKAIRTGPIDMEDPFWPIFEDAANGRASWTDTLAGCGQFTPSCLFPEVWYPHAEGEPDEEDGQAVFAGLFPVAVVHSDAGHRERLGRARPLADMHSPQRILLGIWGQRFAAAICQAHVREGVCGRSLFEERLSRYPQAGAMFSRAFDAFTEGEFEAAASLALPRIEYCLREVVAASCGQSVLDLDREGLAVNVLLGGLLNTLKTCEQIPTCVSDYLIEILGLEGLNLRNRVAHGLVQDVHPEEAALLIHIALILTVLLAE